MRSVNAALMRGRIWLSGPSDPPPSEKLQTDTFEFQTLVRESDQLDHKSLKTVSCLHCMTSGLKGLNLLGTGYKQHRPVNRCPVGLLLDQ